MSEPTRHPVIRGLRNALVRQPGQIPAPVDLTITDGLIAAIDPPGTLEAPDTLDAAGRCVHPGFVDSHLHFSLGGETLRQLDLSGVRSRAAFEAAIAERSAELEPGTWLQALGWNEANWPDGAMPDRSWLRAAGDRPTVCYRMDFHACVVNEPVLAMLEGAACPPGGRINRDQSGEPDGLMVESAAWHLVITCLAERPSRPWPSFLVRERRKGLGASHKSSSPIRGRAFRGLVSQTPSGL